MTHLYKWLSACRPTTDAELASRDRSIKNILHIFSRLLQYTAAHKDVMEQSVSSLFARLHERVSRDEAALNASARIVFHELSAAFGQIGLNDSAVASSAANQTISMETEDTRPAQSKINEPNNEIFRSEPKKTLLESYV